MKPRRADALFALVALLFCGAVWWPTRTLPYHWDGALFVAPAARDLLQNNFSPFIFRYTNFAHPPLFIAGLALIWKLFGKSLLVAHLYILPFLPLLLASIYGVGVEIRGRAVGAAAAALTACTAVVVSEYGQIYFDLPLAALLACGLWLALSKHYIMAGLVFSIAAGMKIPALIYPGALLAAALLHRKRLTPLWPMSFPFIAAAVWLVYHHAVEGFWLALPGRQTSSLTDIGAILHNVWLVSIQLCDQRRWFIAAAAIACWLAVLARERFARPLFRTNSDYLTLLFILAGGIFISPPTAYSASVTALSYLLRCSCFPRSP